MADTFQPPWQSPTNWFGGTPFPSEPPNPTGGKLSYADWYNKDGKNMVYSISFGSPAANYLDYLGQAGGSQPSTPAGPGMPKGTGGAIDTVSQQPGQPAYGPGGAVPGGYKAPQQPTQNQGIFQNTQYSPLTPYMNIGGQGSMNQTKPFPNNDPAGATQGFYNSLPNYGFYQR